MKPKRVAAWPAEAPAPAALAAEVTYIGSAEHKSHPSPAGPPRLRENDASRCDPRYVDFDRPTQALREGVMARRTSDFQGRFPKYVWGTLDGQLYEARLVNHELGQYKAYPIERVELPADLEGLIEQSP